jgi:hypothetical protein
MKDHADKNFIQNLTNIYNSVSKELDSLSSKVDSFFNFDVQELGASYKKLS